MKKLALYIADLVALYAALALTLLGRYPNDFLYNLSLHWLPFSILFILWIGIFYINGLFDTHNLRNNNIFYGRLLRSIGIASSLSIIFFYTIRAVGISPRTNLFLFIIIFTLLEIANRAFFNRIIEKRFHRKTIIVGTNPIARELAQFIKENPQLGYELTYIVDTNPETFNDSTNEFASFGILQGLGNIEQVIKKEKISVVVLSPEAYKEQEIIDMFYKLLEYGVSFHNLASIYEKLTGRVPLGAINQVWFLENISEGQKRFYELVKRGIDIILGVFLGIITLVLLPFIAFAIKVNSSGSIFYRQKRVGRLGKPFEMIKFRTMREHAERESGAVWAQHNDPRITGVGSFLRKTRLDELPQVWNILKGEMSFVGPRAERPEFHGKLTQEIPFYEERYLVKPGATGWAQLQRSYYASIVETHEKLQYDLYYIKNRSFVFDIGIFLRTLNLVLRGGGR